MLARGTHAIAGHDANEDENSLALALEACNLRVMQVTHHGRK